MKKVLLSMAVAGLGMISTSFAQTIAISQNFEGVTVPALPAGWVNTATGGGTGWVTNNTSVNWQVLTMPAHGNYAYINDMASYHNDPTYLTSPTFSLSSLTTPYLSFDYFYVQGYYGSGTYPHEQAWVEVSTNGGSTWTFADSMSASVNTTTETYQWMTAFVDLSSFSATSTCQVRFCYTDQGGVSGSGIFGLAVSNVVVYGNASNFIGLNSVTPIEGTGSYYIVAGGGVNFGGTVYNYGSTAVTSFTAGYKVGSAVTTGISVTSADITGGSVAPYSTATFTIPTAYTVTTTGLQNATVWVSETGSTPKAVDTATTAIFGVGFKPVKRELFEEATGTWCGFCVRGIVYMDSLWKNDSNSVSIISVHDADPMSQDNANSSSYDTWISSQIGGYPSMVIDRRYTDDPSNALVDHAADASLFGYANMGITMTTTGGDVNVTAQLEPAINMSGSYQLELVIEEYGVHDTLTGTETGTTAGYFQHDYYGINGADHTLPTLSGCGYNFTDTTVDGSTQAMLNPSLYFPFVARWTIPNDVNTGSNVKGVTGSLPSTLSYGHTYTYAFSSVTIPANWVASKLHAVVMLIDNNPTSATYGQVLNTANSNDAFTYVPVEGVANVSNSIEGMLVFPNPANDEVHVKFGLAQTSSIQLSVFNAVGQEVYATTSQKMNPGQQQLDFSTANFSSGIYNVVMRSDDAVVSQRLSVLK